VGLEVVQGFIKLGIRRGSEEGNRKRNKQTGYNLTGIKEGEQSGRGVPLKRQKKKEINGEGGIKRTAIGGKKRHYPPEMGGQATNKAYLFIQL